MLSQSVAIASLATCHNRRTHTLAALRSLKRQVGMHNIVFDHYLVDDKSTDGTKELVRHEYPDVRILEGTGSLYWAGGMRFGWKHIQRQKPYDYLLVYNDDVCLHPEAVSHLIDVATLTSKGQPVIVSGTVVDPCTGKPTYGGRLRSSSWHPLKFSHLIVPNEYIQYADVCNMNVALISRETLVKIGFFASFFIHSGADYEYGLRLRSSGGFILVAPGVLGTCEANPISDTNQPLPLTMAGRIRYMFDPKREPPSQRWAVYRRYGGPLWFLLFLIPYLTIFFPRRP